MSAVERESLRQRFRDWRARRKHDRLDRKIRARENLRDYKQATGDQGGAGPTPLG
jgi:hypothetical protein